MKAIIGVILTVLVLCGIYVWAFPIAALVILFGNFEMISSALSAMIVIGLILMLAGGVILSIARSESKGAEKLEVEKWIKSFATYSISIMIILGALKVFTPKNGEMLLYAVGAQVLYQNEDAQKIAKSATGILASAIKIVEVKAKAWENNITAVEKNVSAVAE